MSRDIPSLIPAFHTLRAAGSHAVLCTIVETDGSTYRKAGARMIIDAEGNYHGILGGGCFEGDLVERSREVLASGQPAVVEFDMRSDEDLIWGLGLGCNGLVRLLLQPLDPEHGYQPLACLCENVATLRPTVIATGISGELLGLSLAVDPLGKHDLGIAPETHPGLAQRCEDLLAVGSPQGFDAGDAGRMFIDVIPRQHHLLIIGAGPDAVPMARAAASLDWRVTIADHREQNPGRGFFPASVHQIQCAPEALASAVDLNSVSAALLMTHNFVADSGFLKSLAETPPVYSGLLGPTARRDALLEELSAEQRVALEGRIRGPVGLNIGGDSPASIALSAIAEIHAILEQADAASLDGRNVRAA
ncbi:MAG: XdhC family protein [Gammaproteobacteria bacterium]